MTAFVSINYGGDRIRHARVSVPPRATVLDALRASAEVVLATDEGACGHRGSMVTAIDGVARDIDRGWIFYIFERGDAGWRISREMADGVEASDGMRIGWRLYSFRELGPMAAVGPLWSSGFSSLGQPQASEILRPTEGRWPPPSDYRRSVHSSWASPPSRRRPRLPFYPNYGRVILASHPISDRTKYGTALLN
jgi:hypothetical protein